MREQTTLRKNPSRETCEGIIKRILITEVLEHGSNRHFKTASDFMNYFESLYPASDALTKQVQRAIKAMDMPKDDRGFLIVNKTTDQFKQEKELTNLFQQANVTIHPMDQIETIFLSAAPYARTHMIHLLFLIHPTFFLKIFFRKKFKSPYQKYYYFCDLKIIDKNKR